MFEGIQILFHAFLRHTSVFNFLYQHIVIMDTLSACCDLKEMCIRDRTNAHFYKNEKREDIKSHHYIISYVPADVKTEKSSHSERTLMSWPSEERWSLAEGQLSGLSSPC